MKNGVAEGVASDSHDTNLNLKQKYFLKCCDYFLKRKCNWITSIHLFKHLDRAWDIFWIKSQNCTFIALQRLLSWNDLTLFWTIHISDWKLAVKKNWHSELHTIIFHSKIRETYSCFWGLMNLLYNSKPLLHTLHTSYLLFA